MDDVEQTKVINFNQIKNLRKKNKKIVFTNGCFDILHPGHIHIFKKAKQIAKNSILIVGINTDSSIRKIKGKTRPINTLKDRIKILEVIPFIDYIIPFDTPTPYSLIKTLKPDILLKGGDWKKNEIVGREFAKKTVRVPILKKYSTTKIIEKIWSQKRF